MIQISLTEWKTIRKLRPGVKVTRTRHKAYIADDGSNRKIIKDIRNGTLPAK